MKGSPIENVRGRREWLGPPSESKSAKEGGKEGFTGTLQAKSKRGPKWVLADRNERRWERPPRGDCSIGEKHNQLGHFGLREKTPAPKKEKNGVLDPEEQSGKNERSRDVEILSEGGEGRRRGLKNV